VTKAVVEVAGHLLLRLPLMVACASQVVGNLLEARRTSVLVIWPLAHSQEMVAQVVILV